MYKLLPLPYEEDALEPVLSATTISIHYNDHYKKYLNKLNEILKSINYDFSQPIEQLIINIDSIPLEYRGNVLFNAGGVINHELYWKSMGKNNLPKGKLLDIINNKFGSYDNFKTAFINETKKLVGSGYTFLVMDKNKDIKIMNMSNQESPYSYGFIPLLALDLWEHAYYLDYQSHRQDYVNNFFSIINFSNAQEIYETQN